MFAAHIPKSRFLWEYGVEVALKRLSWWRAMSAIHTYYNSAKIKGLVRIQILPNIHILIYKGGNSMKWLEKKCHESENFSWGLTIVGITLMVIIIAI